MELPGGQPTIERRPMSSGIAWTSRGSAAVPQNDQFSVDSKTAQDSAHRITVCYRRENGFSAAQLQQLRGGMLGFAIDVRPGAKSSRQWLLVQPPRDRNGPETHLRCELNFQMAEPPMPSTATRSPGGRRCAVEN
jgi:hypothetical protein